MSGYNGRDWMLESDSDSKKILVEIMSFLSVLCMRIIVYPQEMCMGVGVVLSTARGILGKARVHISEVCLGFCWGAL